MSVIVAQLGDRKFSVSPFEARRARQEITRQLGELRQCGRVEFVDCDPDDDLSVVLRVRVYPLAPRDGTYSDDSWEPMREPFELLLDPLGIVQYLRA